MRACESRGLKLVVSLDHPTCIGLRSGDLEGVEASDDYYRKTSVENGSVITVCIRRAHQGSGCFLVEASRVVTSPVAIYRVTGVWVKQHSGGSGQASRLFED